MRTVVGVQALVQNQGLYRASSAGARNPRSSLSYGNRPGRPGVATRGSHRPVRAQLTHPVPPVMARYPSLRIIGVSLTCSSNYWAFVTCPSNESMTRRRRVQPGQAASDPTHEHPPPHRIDDQRRGVRGRVIHAVQRCKPVIAVAAIAQAATISSSSILMSSFPAVVGGDREGDGIRAVIVGHEGKRRTAAVADDLSIAGRHARRPRAHVATPGTATCARLGPPGRRTTAADRDGGTREALPNCESVGRNLLLKASELPGRPQTTETWRIPHAANLRDSVNDVPDARGVGRLGSGSAEHRHLSLPRPGAVPPLLRRQDRAAHPTSTSLRSKVCGSHVRSARSPVAARRGHRCSRGATRTATASWD